MHARLHITVGMAVLNVRRAQARLAQIVTRRRGVEAGLRYAATAPTRERLQRQLRDIDEEYNRVSILLQGIVRCSQFEPRYREDTNGDDDGDGGQHVAGLAGGRRRPGLPGA